MKISNFLIFVAFIFSTYFMFIFNLTNDKPLKVASQHQTKKTIHQIKIATKPSH